ncbi:hypothetical protein ACFFX0_08170 [Citricoccus parietis]|uniref:Uncharacterized protein n=1 Tax=Citricoccus parietis TaxID=592307 RepID=A0ABV5FWV3_9MICC
MGDVRVRVAGHDGAIDGPDGSADDQIRGDATLEQGSQLPYVHGTANTSAREDECGSRRCRSHTSTVFRPSGRSKPPVSCPGSR